MLFYSHAKSLFAILPELEAELITYQHQSSSLHAAEKSQALISAQCKAILIQEGSTQSSTRIHLFNQALNRMTPDVVAIVKDLLKPNPREEGQGYTFFHKSDSKRKRVDFHAEERHDQTPGNL